MTDRISPLFTWRTAIAKSDLGSTDKLVAFTLSLYMSELGSSAFPGQKTLAKAASLTRQTVNESVRRLEALGWLEIASGKRGGRSNLYTATVPEGVSARPTPGDGEADRGVSPTPTHTTSVEPRQAPRRARARDELYDQLAHVCGLRLDAMTKEAARLCAIAAGEIRAAGGTADQLVAAAANYRRLYRDAALTPKAMANHWPRICPRAPATPPCSDCGVGGGLHAEDCQRRNEEAA